MARPASNIAVNGTTTQHVTYPDGQTTYNGNFFQSPWYSSHYYQDSIRTPGFKKLKRGKLPLNPFFESESKVDYARINATYLDTDALGRTTTTVFNGPATAFYADCLAPPWAYPEEDPSDLAIAKLQGKVNLNKGSLGVTMGEVNKTAAHVAETAGRLAKGMGQLRKGHLGDFMRTMGVTTHTSKVRAYRNRWRRESQSGSDMQQFAAKTWLEYSYAWKPLISDVYAQAQNLSRYLQEYNYGLFEERASAQSRKVYVEDPLNQNPIWANRKVVDVIAKVIYIVRYRIADGEVKAKDVFGLANPALVAWELVPFSFVADWFIPIGTFLEGLMAYNGIVFAGGTRTGQRIVHVKCTSYPGKGVKGSGASRQVAMFGAAESNGMFRELSRTVISDFPRLSPPRLKDPRSIAHAASAISLLQTMFRGSRRGSVSYG